MTLPSQREAGLVVYRASSGVDAIDEYSRRLVDAFRAGGAEARYVAGGMSGLRGTTVRAPWILLQYNPFAYGRWGFAPALVRDARALRRRSGVPLALMVHEAWVEMREWRTTLMGGWQRLQLRSLVRAADVVMTSTEAIARELGAGALHVPVGSTITPLPLARSVARDRLGLGTELVVALFGRRNASRAFDHAEAAIAAIGRARGARDVVVLNLGADTPPIRAPLGVDVHTPGPLAPEDLSLRLRAADVLLLPLTDGVSTRRTTMMTALAHGLPVVGLSGVNTDRVLLDRPEALLLTPAGDREAYARAAAELVADPARLHALGAAGRRLYAEQFDWPVIARRMSTALGPAPRGLVLAPAA